MRSIDTVLSSSQAHTSSEPAEAHYAFFIKKFLTTTRYYAFFQSMFFLLIVVEVFSFLCFLSLPSQSFFMASSLAIIFLTTFAYFVLRFYFEAKKPGQFLQIKQEFADVIESSSSFDKSSAEHSIFMASCFQKFASYLYGKEYSYYSLPENFTTLQNLVSKLSAYMHWQDIQKMKEVLLLSCVEKHVQIVKSSPLDLDAHASLGHAYLSLSAIYKPPLTASWVSSSYFSEAMKEKFKQAALRAVEEFKILQDYATQDPWIHAQLASLYHDLKQPQEEILQYETMFKLAPQEPKVLYRLGVLYFEQGLTSKGLRMYEKLKRISSSHAEELISFYDAYSVQSQETL